jgi:1-deoxy-D-xylulose-5-phosphate synthase
MFAIDRAGIVGEDGETHQGIFDISYLRSIPNLTILSPKDIKEFRMMLKWCFSYNGPVAIRYPRGGDFDLSFGVHEDISYGKWEIISKGSKIAILAVGKMTQVSKIVVDKLKNKGLNVTFVNCRFIKPMDNKMLDNIFETHEHIFTIEDNYINGGFGSGVLEYSSMKKYSGKISLIGFPNEFIPHGSCGLLYKKYNLDAEGILDYIYKNV